MMSAATRSSAPLRGLARRTAPARRAAAAPARAAHRCAAAAVAEPAEEVGVVPSAAEEVRSALALCNGGTLSVVAEDGWPLGLHVDFALDEGVRPIMRVVAGEPLAEALSADARCTLNVDATRTMGCQLALKGRAVPLEPEEAIAAEGAFAAVGLAASAADLRRMEVDTVLYSGPHDECSWVDAEAYQGAEVDPLSECALAIVADFNTKYYAELQGVVRVYGGAPMSSTGVVTWVDRLGFDLSICMPESPDGEAGAVRNVRVPFERPVIDETDARSALTMMTHLAWKQA